MHIKICCIQSIDEARLAEQCGATAIGLVGPMPSGPGVIDDVISAQIVAATAPNFDTFLLTSELRAEHIIAHHLRVKSNTIQLVDDIEISDLVEIRKTLNGINLIQVIHVSGEQSIAKALLIAPFVDGILLDSGSPDMEVKQLGGTGRTHDWGISRKIVRAVSIPVYLAGGLNTANVAKAIETVKPFGVDVCSGVRTNGDLDEVKLISFIHTVNEAAV